MWFTILFTVHNLKICFDVYYGHGRRSSWTSGGTHDECRRWVRAKWGGAWGGVSPLQPTKGSGGASAENGFWRILKATRRLFLYLYDKIWGGTICISVPPLQILGGLVPLPPPSLPPWSTPMIMVQSTYDLCLVMSSSCVVANLEVGQRSEVLFPSPPIPSHSPTLPSPPLLSFHIPSLSLPPLPFPPSLAISSRHHHHHHMVFLEWPKQQRHHEDHYSQNCPSSPAFP